MLNWQAKTALENNSFLPKMGKDAFI